MDNKTLSLPKAGRYEFMAEPFHCDFSDALFMGHLGNAMLNAADFHSNERGYGMHYLTSIHKTWVLSRLTVEMTEMPRAYDRFSVETWVDSVMRYFTSRNFKVTSPDGQHTYGYGRSIWAMIDTDTRQPVEILDVKDGLIEQYVDSEKVCPIAKSGRVRVSQEAPIASRVVTQYSDIDFNGHVNSVKYIEHVLNLFDLEWYRTHFLQRFEIAYVAESYQGDQLNLYQEEAEPGCYHIRITKGTQNETEVVRCIVKFVNK